MGRTQTSTDEGGVSHESINNVAVDSEPTLSTTPEPPAEKEVHEFLEEQQQSSVMKESRVEANEAKTIPENKDLTQSITQRMTEQKNEKSEDKVDVMSLPSKVDLVWRNIYLFIYLHAAAAIGLYLLVTGQVMWQTIIWSKF